MLTKNINFKNFKIKKNKNLNVRVFQLFKKLIKEDNQIIHSASRKYTNSYKKKIISKFKNKQTFVLI